MSRNEKMEFIRLIEGSDLSILPALAKYNIPRSTYCRWKQKLKKMGTKGLEDISGFIASIRLITFKSCRVSTSVV
jgi:hypothetical protein